MRNDGASINVTSWSQTDNSENGRKRDAASFEASRAVTDPQDRDDDDDDYIMDVAMESNECKRPRLKEPISPSIVSLPTTDLSDEMDFITTRTMAVDVAPTAIKLEWWKQQQQQQRLKSKTPASMESNHLLPQRCIVCQSPCESSSTSSSTQMNVDAVSSSAHNNHHHHHHHYQTTLLQYFPPKFRGKTPTDEHGYVEKKLFKMVLSSPPELPSITPLVNCTFCEKTVCINCQGTCEECQHIFCSFCSTKDYSTTVERILCLDCRDRSKESSLHMLID